MPERMNNGLIRWDGLLWALVLIRKDTRCRVSGRAIESGSPAWRPLTQSWRRRERVSPGCLGWEIPYGVTRDETG
jgi:hypothetical protein